MGAPLLKKKTLMKELKFKNNVFNKGVNVTVRRGIKWASEVGKRVVVGHRVAEILSANVIRFGGISDFHLSFEHDPACRTKEGLLNVMKEIYDGFTEDEIITVLTFSFVDSIDFEGYCFKNRENNSSISLLKNEANVFMIMTTGLYDVDGDETDLSTYKSEIIEKRFGKVYYKNEIHLTEKSASALLIMLNKLM